MNWADINLVIFDADNTLRRRKDLAEKAPLTEDDWELMPGILDALDRIMYYPVVFGIASNQACVGRKEISSTRAYNMLVMLAALLGFRTSPIAIKMCSHIPEDYCECRKPNPQMLNDIMDFWDITPENTLFIGDALTDQEAAENAGCQFMFIEEFLRKE